MSVKAVKGLRCAVCARSSRPKPPNPSKIRDNVGMSNHTLMADLGYVDDAEGRRHTFLVLVDEGTDYCVIKRIEGKKAHESLSYIESCWIDFAGPPDIFTADSEKGFIG